MSASDLQARVRAALADRYHVVRKLGEGGMAVVFQADEPRHGRRVAIKVLREEAAALIGADRFLREIQVTAQLSHPHVLPLLDSGSADGHLYFVTPLVEGETLRDRIARERQLPVQDAIRITEEIADALAYAHGRGILHRDIKPENILLSDGHALVADFGIARVTYFTHGGQRTQTGIAIGTPAYMSPEQAAADPSLDARSDLYSLACVTYEMLTGEPPFGGATPQQIVARRFSESAPPLRRLRAGVSPALESAVARGLARAPDDRQRSVHEYASELRAAGNVNAESARPRVGLAAGAVLVLVALIALLIGQSRSDPSASTVAPPRLAVLPLENLGSDVDAPFAAGITEEIMSRLAEIGGLQVVSRTSASRFRDSKLSMNELGSQLHADYILEGSVRTDRSGAGPGGVRVIARLIRVNDDVRVWEQPYDATLVPGDIFRVQTEIATRVARALDLTLGATEQHRVQRVNTTDSAAYRLYQLGRFQWTKRDPASLKLAQASFRAAVVRDPTFAEAYAGLSDALGAAVILYPDDSVQSSKRLALEAAQRAVALDSSLAAAHAALGFDRFFFEWDWVGAEAAFRRAITLDPGYGPARYWYTQLLWVVGRHDEALAQAESAVANDPLSAVAYLARARSARLLGSNDAWIVDLRRASELQDLAPTWADLAEHYAVRGDADSARLAAQQFIDVRFGAGRSNPELASAAARVLAGNGDAVHTLRLLARAGVPDSDTDALAAQLFAHAGLPDSAFARLHRMETARNSELVSVLPFLQRLLERDARWAQLRERLDRRS